MDKSTNVEEYITRQRVALASNPECGTTRYNLAMALLGLKQYDEARQELLEAVECSPGLAEAYIALGGICMQQGDMEGCLEYNKMAVNARPGFSEGYGNIGFVELHRGNVDEAITALKRATAFNFRYVQAFANLGTAYLIKGNIDDSIEASLKALKLHPEFAPAHNNLTIAYLEKGDFQLAIEHCDMAVELGYAVSSQILDEINAHRKE